MANKTTVVTVREIPEALWRRIKKRAIDRGVTIQTIVVEALENHLRGKR